MEETQKIFFAETVENCRNALFRIARMMVSSDADAEDAVSSATLAAFSHLPALRKQEALPGYLMRCVIHACHKQLRCRKREISAENLEIYASPPREETPIWVYLSHLPEKYRLPLALRYGENLSLEDTANILRIPKGTVSSRCSRGLNMLRAEMGKEESSHDG